MKKTTILWACLLMIGSLFAADWVMDGNRVYWAANGYQISAYPATSHGMSNTQYVNFSSSNPTPFTGNFSFVFSPAIISGQAELWANTNHPYQSPIQGRVNYQKNLIVLGYVASPLTSCDFGDLQNNLKYLVNTTNATNIKACFDSFTNVSNNYTIIYSLDGVVGYETLDNYYFDWKDISNLFTTTTIGNSQVFTINDVQMEQGTNYQVRFKYQTRIGTSGKYDIFVHGGSPAQVVAGTAPIYLKLDPWYNSSYSKRYPINCSNIDVGIPIVVNGSGGVIIDGEKQTIWTKCNTSIYLYYNNKTTYEIGNNSSIVPFEVEQGNVTSYNPTQVWSDQSATMVLHLMNKSDSSGNANDVANTGSGYSFVNSTQCTLGGCVNMTDGSKATKLTKSINYAGATQITAMVWVFPYENLTDSTRFGGAAATVVGNAAQFVYRSIEATGSPGYGYYFGGSAWGTPVLSASSNRQYKSFHAFSISGSSGSYYLNDTNQSQTRSTYDGGTGQLTGVCAEGSGTCFLGLVDEFRIYNTSKNASFINQTYQNSIGTVGYGMLGSIENTVLSPTINNVSIFSNANATGTTLYATSTLRGFANITDTAAFNITFTWYLNNATNATGSITSFANNTLTSVSNISTGLVKGQNWTIQVKAIGTGGNQTNNSSQITINNSAPTNANIAFTNPSAGHWFYANGSVEDGDGGPDIKGSNISITSPVTGTCTKYSNGTSGIGFWQVFNCTSTSPATPTFTIGFTDGSAAYVQVLDQHAYPNNNPTLSAPAIAPALPKINETVTCTAGVFADVDGDAENVAARVWAWYKNNSVVVGATTTSLTNSSFAIGDSIKCQETATNTTWSASVAANSSTVVIQALVTITSCNVSLTPNPANASGNVTANATPSGVYNYWFYDSVGTTLQNGSSTILTIPTNYSYTRVYVNATSGTASCANYSLVATTAQQGVGNNLFSTTITDWFNTYASLIMGIFAVGIAYGITSRIGHAALASCLMYAALWLILANPLFLYGALTLLVIGLVATYANI